MEKNKRKRSSLSQDEKEKGESKLLISGSETSSVSGHVEDEQKDLEKLEKETEYLTDLNNFFPELVWKLVLGNITDPNQIEDCSNSSPFFGKVLSKQRETEVVLPIVFSTLARRYNAQIYFEEELGKDPFYRETNFDSIPWKVNPKLNDEDENLPDFMTGLWKCRLVCKSWNIAIEDLHQDEELGYFDMFKGDSKHGDHYLNTWATDRFSTRQDGYSPQIFLKHFENTHYNSVEDKMIKNPFLGRSVHVTHVRNLETSQNFLEGVLEILRKYGQEVSYFCLYCFDANQSADDLVLVYKDFKEMVQLMPNLMVLKLFIGENAERWGVPRFLQQTDEEILALEEEISRNPFVKLTDLRFLFTQYLPVPIFNEVLSKNRHLTQLEVVRLEFHGNYEIFNENMPNLKELSLQICSREDFEKFEGFQFSMKLEKLYLFFETSNRLLPWSDVIDGINRKLDSESLNELILQMPSPRAGGRHLILDDSLDGRLNFPKLQEMRILEAPSEMCLDFLMPCKNSLERLVIKCSINNENGQVRNRHELKREEVQDFEDRQKIDFLGFQNKMQESNISREFPSLKTLIIENGDEKGEKVKYEF